jgi:hypothetical protein
MSDAGIAAVREVVFTKVVGRDAPFQYTIDVALKLVPVTVRVKSGPPETTVLGLMLVIVGTRAVIVKTTGSEVSGPGLTTVTSAWPGTTTSLEGIWASRVVPAVTTVVGRDEPFHCTTELGVKPVPVTVSVKPELPAGLELGTRRLITGFCAYTLPACRSPNPSATATNPLPIHEKYPSLVEIIGHISFR